MSARASLLGTEAPSALNVERALPRAAPLGETEERKMNVPRPVTFHMRGISKCPFDKCSESRDCSVHKNLRFPYHFPYCNVLYCFQLTPCPSHQGMVREEGAEARDFLIPSMRYFNLKEINYKWHSMVPFFVHEAAADTGPIRGAHTSLAVAMEIWNMNGGDKWDESMKARWEESKQHLKVGLIKETLRFGNTSVSMGLAELYFARPGAKNSVAFLNCGNGGVKYQRYHYDKATNIISTDGEYKPGQMKNTNIEAVKLGELICGLYKPAARKVKEQDLMAALAIEYASAPWKQSNSADVDVFAFITGQLRNYFSKVVSQTERKEMNDVLGRIFANNGERIAHPVSDLLLGDEATFFIPESQEAKMECFAASRMFTQVQDSLPGSERLEPIVTLGIGQNSTQWCLLLDGKTYPMEFPDLGMEHPDVSFVGEQIVERYLNNPDLLEKFITAIEQCVKRGNCPTIALKSGCLLVLNRPQHDAHCALKEVLSASPEPVTQTHTVTLKLERPENSHVIELQVPVEYTVSQLCAVAVKHFRAAGQKRLQFVMADDKLRNQKITSVTSDLDGRTIYLRSMTDTKYFGIGIEGEEKITTFETATQHIPLKWKVKSPKSTEIEHPCFPLSWIVDKWHLVKGEEAESGRLKGTEAALIALKDLWLINREKWQQHCRNIYVGIVKSTFDCGNSSVSMGAAVHFLRDTTLNTTNSKFVAFLNCGTGGIKYQLYTSVSPESTSDQFRIALIAEYKPGKGKFSNLVLAPRFGYKVEPKRGANRETTTKAELRDLVQRKLALAPWNSANWPTGPVPTFAFITGALRNHWEKSAKEGDEVTKGVLQSEVAEILFGVRPVSDILTPEQKEVNHFITHQHEGQLELFGSRWMYNQLIPGLDAVATLSFQRSGSRFTSVSSGDMLDCDFKHFSVGPMFAGMNNEDDVSQIGPGLVRSLEENENLIGVVSASFANGRQPMITLKGGGLLMIDSDPRLRQRLVERPPFSQEIDTGRVNKRPSIARPLAPRNSPDSSGSGDRSSGTCDSSSDSGSSSSDSGSSSSDSGSGCVTVEMSDLNEPSFALSRSIRVPITVSRLCTEAAVALGQVITSFFYVFISVPGQFGEMQLIELTGSDNVLSMSDLRNVQRLYFSKDNRDQVNPDRSFVELYGIAKEIYPTLDLWEEDVERKYGASENKWVRAALMQAAQRPHELQGSSGNAALGEIRARYADFPWPAPKGPLARPPRTGDAITCWDLRLPLGRYPGDFCTFDEAVKQQLGQLGIDEAKSGSTDGGDGGSSGILTATAATSCSGNGSSSGGSNNSRRSSIGSEDDPIRDKCERLASTYNLVVCLVQPDHQPRRFGQGTVFMWLLHDFARGDRAWAPLWSPRSMEEMKFLQKIRPWFNPKLKCENMDFIKVFAKKWAEIAAFPVTGFEQPLLKQVKQRIFDLVENYVLTSIRADRSNLALLIREWYTFAQWQNLVRDCGYALAKCADKEYKITVGEAFHWILVALWDDNLNNLAREWREAVSANPTQWTGNVQRALLAWRNRWEEFAATLERELGTERLNQLQIAEILKHLHTLEDQLKELAKEKSLTSNLSLPFPDPRR